ncbi:SDR family oxidoreductase [Paraburkholderia sp. 22B1P]|uniref:SDR family NAD(P)-dependent oxidoreductase n=1 Tax=Paraburkholderia sp. 22B1P TaxID=3080498 RepID=UPI003092B887|nr:SDR family oxidoreductase [Paraburkholderia sp. 22B1P]
MTTLGKRLDGKVVLISGAASDIGVAIASRCIAEGASVVCADLDPEAAARTARELGPAALDVRCDVTDLESARASVELTQSRFGRLDGYVHNAAAPWHDGSVEDLDPVHWHQEIDVSLTGAFLMSRFVVPAMRNIGGGSIVLVASQLGHVAAARSVAYCAGKAGLIHLARLMAVDHADAGIRVNSLSPGAVRTGRLLRSWPSLDEADMKLGPAHVLGRIGRPEEIGAGAAFLLSEDASFVTATDLLVDGGYTAR